MKALTIATKLLGLALPLATTFVIVLLLTAGGIAQVGPMPDLLVYVLELAVRTLYGIAVFGAGALFMRWTGLDVHNDVLAVLLARCSEPGPAGAAARWTVALHTLTWLAVIVLAIIVFRGLG